MLCLVLRAGLLLGLAACAPTPMRWERPGATDTAKDEAECGAQARQEASRRLPYGNGPPYYGVYKEMSLLQWKQEIDNRRYYLQEDLNKACMRAKGFQLVPLRERAMSQKSLPTSANHVADEQRSQRHHTFA